VTTDRQTDHTTPSATIGLIYLVLQCGLTIYTTIKTVTVSVTEVGVVGWAWSLHAKQTWIRNCK